MHRPSCLSALVFAAVSCSVLPLVDESDPVPADFKTSLVYAVPRNQGSWVSLTNADKGRLIACNQRGRLYRITFGAETKIEELKIDVGNAQGLLYAFDSLYVKTGRLTTEQ